MADIILTAVIVLIIGAASLKMIRDNKKGSKCAGCPYVDQATNACRTAMLNPFMPCGAKQCCLLELGALLVQKITKEGPSRNYFILELPEYKFPSLKRATLNMFSRGKSCNNYFNM